MSVDEKPPRFRICHLYKWPHFSGYGFNLHSEKNREGQFIGKIDIESPAEACGILEGDRIFEVNGVNITRENHRQVVDRIKQNDDSVVLLVLSPSEVEYCARHGIDIGGNMENTVILQTPKQDGKGNDAATDVEGELLENGGGGEGSNTQPTNDSSDHERVQCPVSLDCSGDGDPEQDQEETSDVEKPRVNVKQDVLQENTPSENGREGNNTITSPTGSCLDTEGDGSSEVRHSEGPSTTDVQAEVPGLDEGHSHVIPPPDETPASHEDIQNSEVDGSEGRINGCSHSSAEDAGGMDEQQEDLSGDRPISAVPTADETPPSTDKGRVEVQQEDTSRDGTVSTDSEGTSTAVTGEESGDKRTPQISEHEVDEHNTHQDQVSDTDGAGPSRDLSSESSRVAQHTDPVSTNGASSTPPNQQSSETSLPATENGAPIPAAAPSNANAPEGDSLMLKLNMSAAEMRQYLKTKKRSDSQYRNLSFKERTRIVSEM